MDLFRAMSSKIMLSKLLSHLPEASEFDLGKIIFWAHTPYLPPHGWPTCKYEELMDNTDRVVVMGSQDQSRGPISLTDYPHPKDISYMFALTHWSVEDVVAILKS